MKKTTALVFVGVALVLAGLMCVSHTALADGSAAAITDPATSLHDPLSAPAAAFDEIKSAQKIGWPLAVLAAAVILSKLLSRLGGFWSKLNSGKTALVIGALSAASAAAYNALATGGSWMAVALALIVAASAYWDSHAKPKQDAPASTN